MNLPDSAQKLISHEGVPIAKPDFYYRSQNLAIFVDGPDHDKDYVKRDDEQKRSKLEDLGYRVHVIYYASVDEDIAKLSEMGI